MRFRPSENISDGLSSVSGKGKPMKHTAFPVLLLAAATAQANDSTGFVETGGIQYLKNPHIEMQRED